MNLLDVNVLLALAWPNHPFHSRADAWFIRNASRGWATCSLTEAGFIRLSSNPSVIPAARRPSECGELLQLWRKQGKHAFLSDAKLGRSDWRDILQKCSGHQQVNDALLLALSRSHKARLVTFDARMRVLADRANLVEILA